MSRKLNAAEKKIGEICFQNAKHQEKAGRFLNRYERMLRDKAWDAEKEENKEKVWNR